MYSIPLDHATDDQSIKGLFQSVCVFILFLFYEEISEKGY